MYYGMIVGLMLVLPLVSTIGEAMMGGGDIWLLAAKWFVFWGVGVRLTIAGVRQMLQPDFTARDIFEITDPKAGRIVQELGFWNLSGGLIAILSLVWPAWALPAALAGGLFYALAGIQHLRNDHRTMKENAALVSDLFIAAVMAVVVIKGLFFA
jgi:hypothetical protein